MTERTQQDWRRYVAPRRLCAWIIPIAVVVGGLYYAGADGISCAVCFCWGAAIAVTRRYLGARMAAIVSGSIFATSAACAVYMRAVSSHPSRGMEGAVIAIPVAFALGYGLSFLIGAFVTIARWCAGP
jgi:hypothetical protein